MLIDVTRNVTFIFNQCKIPKEVRLLIMGIKNIFDTYYQQILQEYLIHIKMNQREQITTRVVNCLFQ